METFAFDHRFVPFTEPINGSTALPTAILYGDIRQANMYETHYALLDRARKGRIDYVFRPHYDESTFHIIPHSLYGLGNRTRHQEYGIQSLRRLTARYFQCIGCRCW